MDSIDETTLLERLRQGDEAAYEVLIRMYGGRMLAVARGLLRNEEDARDAVQSAYVAAFRGVATFKGTSQLSTWLHRIVVNAALMKLRTKRRKPEQSIEPMLPAFAENGYHASRPVVAWTTSAEEALLQRETRDRVRAAIAALPERYRTVLLLRDIEDRSTREAADLLGITENAVKLRLHRARQALATQLRPDAA